MNFEEAFAHVVGIEGRYSNNPADSGGPTIWGVTEQVARANGYTGPMRDLPLSTARMIYKNQYWDLLRLDDINPAYPKIAYELFDTAVNCGVGVAGTFLQRSLNVFNRGQSDYPDIETDGVVGRVTLSTLVTFLQKRKADGEKVLLRALNALQGERYISLAERREKDETFVYGWVLNRVEI
jgi:lysozyme family protein